MTAVRKHFYKKIAFALSIALILLWLLLGAGASLAWFSDTAPEVKNILHFADFDLTVSLLKDGKYEEVDGQTSVFEDSALYEPGYTRVAFLKIENNGDVPFYFSTALSVSGFSGTNSQSDIDLLRESFRFGLLTAESDTELFDTLDTRPDAVNVATTPLNNYSTDEALLNEGDTVYMALILRMPEEVGNEGQNRGAWLELGLVVRASQKPQ
ncbi:MAG: hypothetical protein J6M34_08395 [Clostridia bacterium]|nr:hypothetical protein [Clostridia bacterium]